MSDRMASPLLKKMPSIKEEEEVYEEKDEGMLPPSMLDSKSKNSSKKEESFQLIPIRINEKNEESGPQRKILESFVFQTPQQSRRSIPKNKMDSSDIRRAMDLSTLNKVLQRNNKSNTEDTVKLIDDVYKVRQASISNFKRSGTTLRSGLTIKQKLENQPKVDSSSSLQKIKEKYKKVLCGESFVKKLCFEITLSPTGILLYNISLVSCVIPICMYHDPMTKNGIKTISFFNITTLSITLFLLLTKMRMVGCKDLKKDYFLFFDLAVIMISYIEIGASYFYNLREFAIPSSLASLFIIRIILRFKTLRTSSSLRDYYKTYLKMFESLKQLVLFIMIMVVIYSLIGMRLFGDIQVEESNEILKRNNFKNFPRALLSAFTIVSSETWAQVYFEFKNKVDKSVTTGYFFSLYFFVAFIMLNFLLSIILNSISEASKRMDSKSKMKKMRNKKPNIDALIMSKDTHC